MPYPQNLKQAIFNLCIYCIPKMYFQVSCLELWTYFPTEEYQVHLSPLGTGPRRIPWLHLLPKVGSTFLQLQVSGLRRGSIREGWNKRCVAGGETFQRFGYKELHRKSRFLLLRVSGDISHSGPILWHLILFFFF